MFQIIGVGAAVKLAATIVSGGIFASLALFATMPASVDTSISLSNAVTKGCLQAKKQDPKSVETQSCNNADFQRWTPRNGTALQNNATHLCLESDARKQVYTSQCSTDNNNSYQKWALGSDSSLRNLATGLCLESKTTSEQVYTSQCNGEKPQQWSQA
jgi:hypothetical protein